MDPHVYLREDIAFDKQLFGLFFAAGIGALGWLFTVDHDALGVNQTNIRYAAGFVAADALLLASLLWQIKRKIHQLKGDE